MTGGFGHGENDAKSSDGVQNGAKSSDGVQNGAKVERCSKRCIGRTACRIDRRSAPRHSRMAIHLGHPCLR
eukprot:364927-Chlamydomonas_euryale.AAC.5